jgi:mono/diheme cytochrome c family protein
MNRRVMFACLLLLPLGLLAAPAQQKSEPTPQNSPRAASSAPADAGAKVFAANCSRCHQAPMSLSPRTTGTVIMHMRTRARLSREDEKLLLKYMAP